MSGLLLLIKKEHKTIFQFLTKIESQGVTDVKELLFLKSAVEGEHHLKEESVLFKVLLQKKQITEGGPFCTLYFDSFRLNSPEEICRQHDLTWAIPSEKSYLFKDNLPIKIPSSEHVLSEILCDYLILHWQMKDQEKWKHVLQSYLDLQKIHIEKEDNCLLSLAERLLTQEEQKSLKEQWIARSILIN